MKNPNQSSPFKSALSARAIILTLVVIVVAVSSLALVSAQATGMPMVESVRQIFGFQPETRAAQKSVNESEINNSQSVSRASGLFATNKNETDAESSSRGTIAAAPIADPTQTITQTDLYRITVRGADGGNGDSGRGGSGATVTATFQLQAGDVLTLVTGIAGGNSNGGGGGGTAVILTRSGAKTLLIVAGAGGGAQYSSNNGGGGSAAQGTAGGGSGGSGFGAGYGGGGGGFNANGTSGSGFLNGYGGIQGTTSGGGAGGGSYNGAGAGGYGFGGGGGGSGTGGGGGGYGGGNGGGSGAGGGGGSSFVDSSGTNITRTDGSNGGGTNQNGSISVVVADVIQPDTQLTAFPPNPSNNQIPNFSFTGSDNTTPAANLTFECSLDGATFAACTSPKNYNSLLSSGSHNFRVRAIDAADNIDPTPAEYTWMIDTAPPDTQFSPSPSNPTNPNTGFSFTGSDNFTPPENLTFECSFDNATFTVCTSPKNYNNLSDGQHNFKVRAKDAAGNVDPTPANFDWTVDATPPDTQITAQPSNPTSNTNSSFTFGGSDNLTTAANLSFECSLDNATFSACSSPKEYNGLSDGQHTFQVRAKDAAGNVDSTPANYTWTIDTTSPETNITANPTNPTASTDASFSFNGNDSGSGVAKFECSLDGGEFTECETPKTYTDLAEGARTFQVRAVDAAGNRDQTPASFSWTIDVTAPTVNLTSTAPNQVNAPFDVTATFSESVTGFSESDISVSNGTAGSLAGSGNTYTFNVTPTAPGTVKISIPANAAQDATGNGNTVSNQLTRQFNNLSTLVVTKTADTNDSVCDADCSLREAIAAAVSGNTITFAGSLGGQTITLSEGWNNAGDASALRIFNNISIQGPASGAGITVAVASGVQKRHIQVESSGGLIVSNLTFSGGYAPDYGGSIWNFGALAIRGCTFTQNYAAAEGGAVQSWGGISSSTLIENSTFSGNSSGGVGGAIDLGSAQITIRNATITNNNSTINSGALVIYQTQATMTNTIVAGNAGGDASAANNGAFNAQSTNNLIGTGGAINLQNGVNGNQVGVDAKLAPLGFYGGATDTHALLPDSPAINAGTSANAPATDQRGKARVGQTDIGAFEAPASLIVTNTANSGAGSLRDTIQAANSTTADESITFAIPATDVGCASGVCTITLGGSELTINDAATAGGLFVSNAGGASRIAVSGNNQSRVFYVAGGGNLTLDNLTIRDGKANGFGGGILSNNGSNLNVLNSTITGNSAPNAAGGGIDAVTSTVTITNSTISGNSASNSVSGSGGGGIRLANSNSTITNSTISNNSSQFRGGGIRENGGSLFLRNTIVAGNTAAVGQPDIINQFATITSNGNNLIGNSTDTLNPINWQASDILNQPALLAPLGFYGGSTQTHALLSNSPAINAGTSTDAPATDQRGASRVGQVDIGAFELNNSQNGGNYRVVLPSGRQGVAYSFILLQDKGAPSSLNISSGLPDGVELQQPSNGSLIIAGTPTQNGTFNFTVGLNYNSNATSVLTDYRLEIFSPLTISGTVTYGLTPAGNPVRFVPAVMMSGSGTGNASVATDSSGKYQLSNLIEGGNYTVTASKTGAINSSITAFDATLVLRCVAAGDNCDLSNYQKMVADSDNSGTIASFDATQILRFVAANGQNADTGQTGYWKFDPAQLSFQSLNTSQADQNYVAFLIGDVDGDWAP